MLPRSDATSVYYKNPWFAKLGHDCDVKTGKDDQLPMFAVGGNLMVQIKNLLVRSRMASEINGRGNRFLRSQKAVHEEHLKHLRHPYILHPFSAFRKYWELMMVIVFVIAFVTIPLDVASYALPLQRNLGTFAGFRAMRVVMDMIFVADIVVNFFTGYVDDRNHTTVLDPRKIILHYCLSYFVWDMMSTVPTRLPLLIPSLKGSISPGLVTFLQLCSLLKFVRIYTFRTYFKRTCEEWGVKFCAYETTIALFIYTLFFHVLTCVNMMFAGLKFGNERVYFGGLDESSYYVNWMHTGRHNDKVMTFMHGYLYLLLQSSYIATFAYTGEIMTLIMPYWYMIFAWLLSRAIFFYLVSCLMQVVTISRSSSRKYQEMLHELKEYMMHKQLPMSLQRRLLGYYEFRFQRSYFREAEILGTVTGQLRQDLVMHSCRMVVEKVEFFKTMPINFIAQIVSAMKTEIYMVNDVVVKANSQGNCMYFIASGCVAAYTRSGIEFIHMDDGDYFGEYSLIHKCCPREWNVIAIETCELYRFDYADFVRIIVPYPEFLQKVIDHAQERYEMLEFFELRYQG